MKEDTVDQIKDFTVTLDRMNKGDITLNNKFSTMRAVISNFISVALLFALSFIFDIFYPIVGNSKCNIIIIQYRRNDKIVR